MVTPHQIALDLPPRRTWGGRRAGAGRKPGPRPCTPRGPRRGISRHTPCHVTLRVRSDVPSLRNPRVVREIEHSLRLGCERGAFRVVQYSLQRDHVHLLVEAEGARALAHGMMSIGARIARAVNRVFRRRGAVMADRFHHRVLRTPREVRNALRYVLANARKHRAAFGSASQAGPGTIGAEPAGIDPASSGRWFDGWTQKLPRPAEASPVAPGRSWLLRIGWWRHGRIDPEDTPGRG